MPARITLNQGALLLAAVIVLLAVNFFGWPVNRDITTYATIARELMLGGSLYDEIFDTKPPAIFVTYMLAQWMFDAGPMQFFVLQLAPSLVVLFALLRCGPQAGFGVPAGLWAGLFWVALSGDVHLQMQSPNTELYINACVALALLQFLRLDGRRRWPTVLSIGVLCAVACLFKTVAIAMAVTIGLAHVLCPPSGGNRKQAMQEVSLMAAGGAAVLGSVFAYFALTGRFAVFKEAMIDAGAAYAGDIGRNIVDGITLSPFTAGQPVLGWAAATLPWLALAGIAGMDRENRRSWVLLGAYAFSALIAVGMPGQFYAHYFQLLVPPLCLGIGWLIDLLLRRVPVPRLAVHGGFGLALAVLATFESRAYLSSPEEIFRDTYAELYVETRALGQRLGGALRDDESVYQWGEETGIYWYSGKRAPASILTYPLLAGPQAPRLQLQSLAALRADPPDLVVAAKYVLESSRGHTVFEWILENYRPLMPDVPGERKFFVFYVPADAEVEFIGRVLGQ
jgi:hypothetical protein